MPFSRWMLLVLIVAPLGLQSCRPSGSNPQPLSTAGRVAAEDSVRRFTAAVAIGPS